MANHAKGRTGAHGTGSHRSSDTGTVQSLSRALFILEALAESDEGLTLTALSGTAGLPPSTAHRLLTTLQRRRFVRFDPDTFLWQVGVQAFVVGNAFTRTRDVVMISRPYMRRLMEKSGETANLYLMNEGQMVCMAQVESRQIMRAIARPGGTVAMHCSGAGKAILAHLSGSEVKRIAARGLPRATVKTLASLTKLRTDLRDVCSRGFAIDDEEYAVGLRCVAAPILDESGAPIAALSLSGPTARVSDDKLEHLGASVVEAARAATTEIGGRVREGG